MQGNGAGPADLLERGERWWYAERRSGLRRRRPARWLFRAFRLSALVTRQRSDVTSRPGVLARLWLWQIWRRTVRRPVTVRCAEGSLLRAPSWSAMAAVLLGAGLTEREDALFVLDLLRPGDLFVDVGANIGFYTVLAARRGARVQAFEPAAQARAVCEHNARLNGVQARTTVSRAACGDARGVARFTTGLDIRNHLAGTEEPGVDVPVTTLDDELAHQAHQSETAVTMLKIDAEGHDLDVLRGALGAVERLRPAILIEIWLGGARVRELLDGLAYRPYAYDPDSRLLAEIAPGARQRGNLLLISDPTLERVRARVETAERPTLRAPSVRWMGRGAGCEVAVRGGASGGAGASRSAAEQAAGSKR
jgi:FkbM family methyltransferase